MIRATEINKEIFGRSSNTKMIYIYNTNKAIIL